MNPPLHAFKGGSYLPLRGFAPGQCSGAFFFRLIRAAHAFYVARASLSTPHN
jgi:hypothetical protein